MAFTTPFALAYALHARGDATGRIPGRIALALAILEAGAGLAAAGGWLWKQLG